MARDSAQAWLIWSDEDAAWWLPNSPGYATRIAAAGRYSLPEASEICEGRSSESLVMAPEMTSAVMRAFRATVRQLEATSRVINDDVFKARTLEVIEEARAVLKAAGVDPDN